MNCSQLGRRSVKAERFPLSIGQIGENNRFSTGNADALQAKQVLAVVENGPIIHNVSRSSSSYAGT
jgi:hypothetical protein